MSTTAVQKQTETKRDIRSLIQSDAVKSQMAMVLPKHLTADRMARVACTAILKTPKLAQCKTESLLQALMLCSQAGLEPDGRNAHLIPYGDIVQVIFDWKGLVALARRNGVQNIAADIVCENDLFEWHRDGDGLHFKHQIDFRKDRGQMFAAYCIWKDGEQFDGEVMTKAEVDGIRKRSKAGNSGPWVTDYNEMAKKTVVRRSSKKWPLDAELAEALNDADSVVAAPAPTARPIFSAPLPALPEMTEAEAPQPDAPEAADDIPMETPTPLATEAPSRNTNYVKGLRGLMKLAGVEESELLDFMRATHGWDDSLSSLEEVSMAAPAKLAAAYDDWTNILAQINKVKKGGKK
jgi:recombination protein RecT